MFKEITKRFQYLSFTRPKQQAFLEDLSSLIANGVPVQQAVTTIQKVTKGIEQEVSKSILKALAEGKQFADGMEDWFPQHIVAIVRTGEMGGTLSENVQAAAQALSRSVSVATSLLASLTYPLIVMLLACGVAVFLKHSIFANFVTMMPVAKWPEIGKNFMRFATFIELWWWAAIIFIMALIFLFTQILRLYIGEWRKFLDRFPPFSTYRAFVAARFMEVMGLLVTNGISFKNSLLIIQRKSARYLMWHVYMMQLQLGKGKENIAEVLDTGLISEGNIIRLKVISQCKGFERALISLGEQSTKKSAKQMELIGKILGGLLLVVDAMIAIFMILSVYNVGSFIGTAG